MNELARRLAERESFLPHGALELIKRLRVRGRKAFLALQFIEETLRERGLDHEELQRTQDHIQAARQISVGNTLTSLTARGIIFVMRSNGSRNVSGLQTPL